VFSPEELNGYFEELKGDFPIFSHDPSLVYLDSAATTQKPSSVLASVRDFYERNNSNVHRGVYPLAEAATELYESSRRRLSNFVSCKPGELVFTKSSTEGLNILASSLSASGDYDTFIVPIFEHHSNFVPWQYHARRNGLRFIPLPVRQNSLDMSLVHEAIRQMDGRFVFSLAGLVNSTGYRPSFEEIGSLVHSAGGIMVLDGAQLIPHEKFSFSESNVDFLVFSGHKMLAETGVGCLVGREKLLGKLNPFVFGGQMIDMVGKEETTFAEGVAKFEGGTQNISGAVSMMAAVEYLENAGMERVSAHVSNLIARAREKIGAIGGYRIHSPESSRAVITFTHSRVHSHDIAEFMGRKMNVALRSGHHCSQLQMKELGIVSACRASFYLYNTFEDVDRLADSLEKAGRWFDEFR
jgi:cysteine desulfurase/selenocysteine lyase